MKDQNIKRNKEKDKVFGKLKNNFLHHYFTMKIPQFHSESFISIINNESNFK